MNERNTEAKYTISSHTTQTSYDIQTNEQENNQGNLLL